MAEYEAVEIVIFKERQNRFIATCLKKDGEEIITHVKNTGRCKELLIPGVEVAVNFQDKPTRKTKYDLIAVKKKNAWFNIDSQLPNDLVEEGIKQNLIKFAILKGEKLTYKREYTYKDSRFDFLIETNLGERLLIEVKGMTLEDNQVGSFPDAPTLRGLKHVETLIESEQDGYLRGVIFVAQFENIEFGTINHVMQPALNEAFKRGIAQGLDVQIYNTKVTPSSVEINREIPFKIEKG